MSYTQNLLNRLHVQIDKVPEGHKLLANVLLDTLTHRSSAKAQSMQFRGWMLQRLVHCPANTIPLRRLAHCIQGTASLIPGDLVVVECLVHREGEILAIWLLDMDL